MSYIHHIFDFIIFPFYAQYYQRFIYIFSKIYNSHLVIIYISDNSFSKKGNEISPTPFVISYLFTIPLHLHPLIPPRHWLSLFLCNLTAVFIQTQKDRFPLLWYFWILLFRQQIVDSSIDHIVILFLYHFCRSKVFPIDKVFLPCRKPFFGSSLLFFLFIELLDS